jgi:imidazolonepropionase-like amidohydrolase
VASSFKEVDGKGLFLAPGLIDSHVHLTNAPGMSEQARLHPDIEQAELKRARRSHIEST